MFRLEWDDEMSKYKYKIADTTVEQRRVYAFDGELCKLGGGRPSRFARDLMRQYVEGKLELDEAKEAVLARYRCHVE